MQRIIDRYGSCHRKSDKEKAEKELLDKEFEAKLRKKTSAVAVDWCFDRGGRGKNPTQTQMRSAAVMVNALEIIPKAVNSIKSLASTSSKSSKINPSAVSSVPAEANQKEASVRSHLIDHPFSGSAGEGGYGLLTHRNKGLVNELIKGRGTGASTNVNTTLHKDMLDVLALDMKAHMEHGFPLKFPLAQNAMLGIYMRRQAEQVREANRQHNVEELNQNPPSSD